ncbi:hypothetical protein GEMRC1_002948 [Eukaryota sp. GEM-RC1]
MQTPSWKLSPNTVLLVEQQRSNPIVSSIKAVRSFFVPSLRGADFAYDTHACGLLLSLRYHNSSPRYIYNRVNKLPSSTNCCLILLMDFNSDSLMAITELCLVSNIKLYLAHTYREAASYIEVLRQIAENKPKTTANLSLITDDPVQFLSDAVPRLSKRHIEGLFKEFKTLKGIANASVSSLASVNHIGPKTAKKIWNLFNGPFVPTRKRTITDYVTPKKRKLLTSTDNNW